MYHFEENEDKHNSLGMLIHSLQSFERIQKWGVDTDDKSSEIPYFIRIVSNPRKINLYSVASSSMNFDVFNNRRLIDRRYLKD